MMVQILIPGTILNPRTTENFQRHFEAEGYHSIQETIDSETGKKQCLLIRYVEDGPSLEQYCEEVLSVVNRFHKQLDLFVGKDILEQIDISPDPQKYWKVILQIPNDFFASLDEDSINSYKEKNRHGPHIKLQETQLECFLRIKARTLGQIQEMFDEAMGGLLGQL